jgi:hypothetical protein
MKDVFPGRQLFPEADSGMIWFKEKTGCITGRMTFAVLLPGIIPGSSIRRLIED